MTDSKKPGMEDGDRGQGVGTWHREAQREKQQGSYWGAVLLSCSGCLQMAGALWGTCTMGDVQAGLAGAHLGAVSQCGWCSED